MARKRDLANKLSQQNESPPARPGWRDAISGPVRDETWRSDAEQERESQASEESRKVTRHKPRNPLQRKTYLLTPELINHIAALAESERVGINELARFLLRSSLDRVESGELEIPTRPATREIVRGE
ncbi:MAG TPA: hypothetical protein VE553_07025 [Candidatus Binatia bacterium]|nr:hypothetical protein [Candidatus Binatia bacterium]